MKLPEQVISPQNITARNTYLSEYVKVFHNESLLDIINILVWISENSMCMGFLNKSYATMQMPSYKSRDLTVS